MNTENLYINDEQFFNYCEENRLLDDTQIEVLKQAAVNVDHIFLDYFVPVGRVDQLIHYCKNKIDEYQKLINTVHGMDASAFVIVSDIKEIRGRGFTLQREPLKSMYQ